MNARRLIQVVLLVGLTMVLHLALGWEWTVLGGLASGFTIGRRGWLYGAIVVALDYVALVIFNFFVDARAVGAMTETMGALLGNMPSLVIVALTILIGALLGLLGGAAGTQLRHMIVARKSAHTAS